MNDEIKNMYLKSHPLFEQLSEEKMKNVAPYAKVKSATKGESLDYGDKQFSRVYLLIKGKIKISDFNENGNELIKDILTAPDIFGDISLHGNDSDEFATTLTPNTIVCYFSVADFKRILEENNSMIIRYAGMVSRKLKKMESRHADLVFRDVKTRLISFIRTWANADGNRIGDKIILSNYLTHTDIANVIATSRQSVNVMLNELRDSGFLHYNRKHIELNNSVAWN